MNKKDSNEQNIVMFIRNKSNILFLGGFYFQIHFIGAGAQKYVCAFLHTHKHKGRVDDILYSKAGSGTYFYSYWRYPLILIWCGC